MKWFLSAAVLAATMVVGGVSEAQAHGPQFVGVNRFGQRVFVQGGRQFVVQQQPVFVQRRPVFIQRRGPVFFNSGRRFSRFGSPVFIDDGFGRFGRRNNFSLFSIQF